MKNMFRIVSENGPIEIEMSEDILDLALMIGSYIDENFAASDYYEIKYTTQGELQTFMSLLQEKQNKAGPEATKLSFALDENDYFIFRDLFAYAYNFLEEDVSDKDFDKIERITEVMSANL